MCWNAAISLNTFLFSAFTLAFVAYNNAHTKYKLAEFVGPKGLWLYAFLFSVIGMQLVEYFLWSNTFSNAATSIFGSLLLLIQPLILTVVADLPILTAVYAIFLVAFVAIKYPGNLHKFSTAVTANGLEWRWFDNYEYQWVFYLAYWLTGAICAFFVPAYLGITMFGVAAITLAKMWNGKNIQELSWGSKYCWGINILSFYYLYRVMIALPWKDMMNLGCGKN
jgi:hypothetical protein